MIRAESLLMCRREILLLLGGEAVQSDHGQHDNAGYDEDADHALAEERQCLHEYVGSKLEHSCHLIT